MDRSRCAREHDWTEQCDDFVEGLDVIRDSCRHRRVVVQFDMRRPPGSEGIGSAGVAGACFYVATEQSRGLPGMSGSGTLALHRALESPLRVRIGGDGSCSWWGRRSKPTRPSTTLQRDVVMKRKNTPQPPAGRCSLSEVLSRGRLGRSTHFIEAKLDHYCVSVVGRARYPVAKVDP